MLFISLCRTENNLKNMEYEVVPDSNLGPFLFKVNINIIYKIAIYGKISLFANDVALYLESESWNTICGREDGGSFRNSVRWSIVPKHHSHKNKYRNMKLSVQVTIVEAYRTLLKFQKMRIRNVKMMVILMFCFLNIQY